MSKTHDKLDGIAARLDALVATYAAARHRPVDCVTVADLPQVKSHDLEQRRIIAAGDAEIRLLRATVRDLVATLETALDVPVIRHAEMRRAVAKARKALGE